MAGKDHKKGRADRAKGKYDPPKGGPLGGLFDTKSEVKKTQERKESYREGYYDKDREIKDSKSRRKR